MILTNTDDFRVFFYLSVVRLYKFDQLTVNTVAFSPVPGVYLKK
jgi:hypothetical protein